MISKFGFRIGSFIFVVILIIGLVIFSQQQFSDGLEYDEIEILEDNFRINGLITYPSSYSSVHLFPGVIIFHGFSANKEMMRGFSEEFARQGFITLTVDALGHGSSSNGIFGKEALKNTGLISLRYFLSRDDVNSSRIGLVGHSMGGSILTQITTNSNIPIASVVIGNSLNPDPENPFIFNKTSPANLLVAMGTYDEIFTIEDTKKNFANSIGLNSITIGLEYGNFLEKTARKIITVNSDHILEIIHPTIIENTVSWISKAVNQKLNDLDGMKHVKHQFITVLIAILVLLIVILLILSIPKGEQKVKTREMEKSLSIRYHSPVLFIGFILGSPFGFLLNSLFTGFFITWFISSGLIYLNISSKYLQENFVDRFRSTFELKSRDLIYGFGIFLIIFLPLQIMLFFLPWDLRFAIPIFAYLNYQRFTQIMIPIMIAGTFLFLTESQVMVKKTENPFISSLKAFYARSWIFMFILGAYFFPIIMSGSLISSPEVGFLTLFIVSFIPLIFVITFITEFARFQNLHPIVSSIITSGIISWALASTLPFA